MGKLTKGEKVFLSARTRLMNEHPFYSTLVFNMKTIPTRDVETMATDGKSLYVNFDWVQTLTVDECMFVLAHEGLHPAWHHITRKGNKDSRKWNYAGDYVINLHLVESGLKMPPQALYNLQYAGMTAEKVYSLIPDPPPSDQQCSGEGEGQGQKIGEGDVGGCGEMLDAPDQSEAGKSEMEREWKVVTAQAVAQAKRMGKLPASVAGLLGELNQSKVDWREYLIRFVQEKCWDDFSWKRPNRNYLQQGLYMPSLHSEKMKKVLFGRDTSGSMWSEINAITSEMRGIMEAVNCQVICIDADAKVQQVKEIEDVQDIQDAHPKGGGGTDFRPFFKYVRDNEEELDVACIVFATDTEGSMPDLDLEPSVPVLWLCTEHPEFNPPFGECIWLK